MNRGALLLQGLRLKLQRDHVVRLRRALHADIAFEQEEDGEFSVIVRPKHPPDAAPFKKLFSKQLVFAGTFHLSPQAWAIEKRACDYVNDIIREVLAKRGVL